MVLKTSSLANIRFTTWPSLVLFGVLRSDVHALCVGQAPMRDACKALQTLIGRDRFLYSTRGCPMCVVVVVVLCAIVCGVSGLGQGRATAHGLSQHTDPEGSNGDAQHNAARHGA